MRSVVLIAFCLVCAFAILDRACAVPSDSTTAATKEVKEPKEIKETATASKDVKDAMKAGKEAKKDCAKDCGTSLDPICVHDPNDANYKPRTFGSQCVLDVYNCEMGMKLVTKNKGKCTGSGGTRLS